MRENPPKIEGTNVGILDALPSKCIRINRYDSLGGSQLILKDLYAFQVLSERAFGKVITHTLGPISHNCESLTIQD
jgi:hypothetical protein